MVKPSDTKYISERYRLLQSRFMVGLRKGRVIGNWISFVASVVCLTALILYCGIYHTPTSEKVVIRIITVCQVLFITNIFYNLILLPVQTFRDNRLLKWIMDSAVIITLLPLLFSHTGSNFSQLIATIFHGHLISFIILGIYSLLEICYGIVRSLSHKTNPSLLLASSFLFFIIIGSLILMLPKCTYNGISFIDSLFIATSAISITGLTPIELSNAFTPFGIGILSLLIQIGALGVLTFTSFFALFFTGNTSIYNQLMVKDMIYSKSANALLPTLIYVFVFTVSIELIGAIAIYFTLPPDFPLTETTDKLIFVSFQSLSAFCNAGFTWIDNGMSNATLMSSNQMIYIVVSVLVIAGGIGFPVLVNIKNSIIRKLNGLKGLFNKNITQHRTVHSFNLNTRIVLTTYFFLTLVTVIFFLLFEWNNTLEGMSVWQKIVQAFFNSTVPRSSGFSSVSPSNFLPITLFMTIFLMWIGGSSQSTAGGIKVNTFAAMLLNLRSIVTERKYITVFHRTISVASVRRANAVIALSILAFFVFSCVMLLLEPALSVKDVLFETASALFTVGSSLGITGELCVSSKLVLCVAMFIGRVGLLSILLGVCSKGENELIIYPYDNIIIN